MTRCPDCRRKLPSPSAARCAACGCDLNAARLEIARLMQAQGGATIYPYAILRAMPPKARRIICQAITRARNA